VAIRIVLIFEIAGIAQGTNSHHIAMCVFQIRADSMLSSGFGQGNSLYTGCTVNIVLNRLAWRQIGNDVVAVPEMVCNALGGCLRNPMAGAVITIGDVTR